MAQALLAIMGIRIKQYVALWFEELKCVGLCKYFTDVDSVLPNRKPSAIISYVETN